uniref:Uncharacterized protein n=1 Tax=Hyaloperonospora arabidopsidis (strain Emoy2) TaxID=559515 RepID=M4BNM5_HYAAE
MNSKDDAEQSSSSFSSTTTRQRKKSPSDNVENVAATETPGRRSARKKQQTTTETSEFVSRLEVHSGDPMMLDEEDDSVLLRSTIAALTPGMHSIAPSTRLGSERDLHEKSVVLSYEADEESEMLFKKHLVPERKEADNSNASPSSSNAVHEDASSTRDGMVAKITTGGGYLMSFFSAATVIGSLVASHMLPREDEEDSNLWRRWLPFLTPVVSLLLFFNLKDAHASAKWVATSLAWRAAAELLLLIGTTPREFEMMVAGSVFVANVSLLIAFVSVLHNDEHVQSKATRALLGVGSLALFLSDSWVISTKNTEVESRVTLMSIAVVSTARGAE